MRRRYTPATVSAPLVFRIPLRWLAADRRRALCRTFAVLCIGFTVAGCAVPGAGRLQGPPKDLPPALHHLTADVMGFTMYDADGDSKRWSKFQVAVDSVAVVDEHLRLIGMESESAAPWMGDHLGLALRQFDVPGSGDDTVALWADVAKRSALEDALEGWDEGDDDALPSVNGDQPTLWTSGDVEFGAAAVFDDGVLFTQTVDGLEGFLDAADEYAVPERKAMSTYAAKAARSTPAAAVFRTDLLRTGVRAPFQDDPALLELARWVTDTDVLVATRDGWVGLATPATGTVVRLTGAVEWVPDLAEEIDWGSVSVDRLADAPAEADVVVAFDDPGQHLTQLVEGITRRNGQYVTDGDVDESGDPVDLQPVLDALDGEAVASYRKVGRILVLRVDDAASEVDDVEEAIRKLGLPGSARADGDALVITIDPSLRTFSGAGVQGVSGEASNVGVDLDVTPTTGVEFAKLHAGATPDDTIAWVWLRSICGDEGPAAGWLRFDGVGEMAFSLAADVSVGDDSGAASTAACTPRTFVPVG